MKETGIVRKVDDLGRIVIPKELRDLLNIQTKDTLEIFLEDNRIILRKYERQCVICGASTDLFTYLDKHICKQCKELI